VGVCQSDDGVCDVLGGEAGSDEGNYLGCGWVVEDQRAADL